MNWPGFRAGGVGAWRAVALAVGCAGLLFASGAVTGWSLSGVVGPAEEGSNPDTAVRTVHPRLIERAHGRLVEQLKLDTEQAERLKSILEQRAGRLREIHERMRPELEQEQQRLEREVQALLDDEQRARWERILEHRRSVFAPPRGRGDDGDGRQRWQRRRGD